MTWDTLPTINSSRVRLRSVTEDDADSLYRIFSHPEVMRYWGAPPLTDRDAVLKLVNEIHDNFRRRASMKWGVALPPDNEVIGTVTLFNLNLDNRRAEIGYGLDRAFWGKGYMNEALNVLIDYAFHELGLHRLEADVDPRNAASIKIVERLGFTREGYLRQRWQVNGEIQDTIFFGLLKPEWEGRQGQSQEAVAGVREIRP